MPLSPYRVERKSPNQQHDNRRSGAGRADVAPFLASHAGRLPGGRPTPAEPSARQSPVGACSVLPLSMVDNSGLLEAGEAFLPRSRQNASCRVGVQSCL